MTLPKDPKINLVLLTDCLADLAGGAEKQIYELAKGLDKTKFVVHIVSLECWGQAPKDIIETSGCQLHLFPVKRVYGISGFLQGFKFFQFLKENHIDILMTYHFSSDLWGTFWGHVARVKMIISNRRDMGFWRNALHVAAYRVVNGWVNKIVTVSDSIKEMIIEQEGLKPGRIEVIYNGVEVPENIQADLQELRGRTGLKSSDTVIMHVANLKSVKGHRYLLEAFSRISTTYPDVKLVLIGKDEMNGQLQEMAKQLNISDKVLFLGKQDKVQNLLKLADICVLPSLSEGMSNAILEYMAAAKPVIATNVGGNPELINDGINGLLIEKENADQLQDAILKLIADKNKCLSMGQNGLLRVKNEFSMEAMIANYEKLFIKKMIKVLHLISSGGLFGAEQMILTLAEHSDGINHTIGALNNHHNPHVEIIEEASKRGLNTTVFASKGRFDLKTVDQVADFIVKNEIDIIHSHNYKANFIAAWAIRRCHKEWVATIHGWIGTDPKLRWYENLDVFVLRSADKVICVSHVIYQGLIQRRYSPKHLALVSNGIDLVRYSNIKHNTQFKQKLGISQDDLTIVICGRLAPEKGHEILIKAMAQVIKQQPTIKLLIVGDGPLKSKMEEMVKELELNDHVILTGIRQDMPDFYANSDIMVNSSYTEGLPMTILEAMASHVPVIATNVGAVGRVIKDQVNGILLEPGNPDSLAEAILLLFNNKQLRERLAQQAYLDVTAHFSAAHMADEYDKIYSQL